MDFNFRPEDEAFRREVRDFLHRELPPDWHAQWRPPIGQMDEDAVDTDRAMRRKLAAQGWLALAWPREYGGGGADVLRQVVFNEEMEYWRAPGRDPQGIGLVGPSIIVNGSEDQKREHLARIAGGEVMWTQGFSEPEAGSDLASLQARAVRDGDDYVIDGEKVWTTRAHIADWMHVLVRTDPEAPKHKGISYFLLDMRSPGIEMRPLIDMTGSHSFNAVTFRGVRVPARNMLGEENQGWYVATSTLDFERSGVTFSAYFRRLLEDAVAHLRADGSLTALARYKVADLSIATQASRMLSYRVAWMQQNGLRPSMEASIAKVYNSELFQRIARTLMGLLGLSGALERGQTGAPLQGGVASLYLYTVSRTISAGTSEIQRNVIATRGLGLPR